MIQQEKIRILVVDDEEEIRETLREIFQRMVAMLWLPRRRVLPDAAGSGVDLACDIKLGTTTN